MFSQAWSPCDAGRALCRAPRPRPTQASILRTSRCSLTASSSEIGTPARCARQRVGEHPRKRSVEFLARRWAAQAARARSKPSPRPRRRSPCWSQYRQPPSLLRQVPPGSASFVPYTQKKAVGTVQVSFAKSKASMEPARRHGHQCGEQNKQHNEQHLDQKVRHGPLRRRLQ